MEECILSIETKFNSLLDNACLSLVKNDILVLEMFKEECSKMILEDKTTHYSPKRLIEFRLGRLCAFLSYRKCMGDELCELRIGANRAPEWPKQVVGSISHGAGYVCAAIGKSDRLLGIGIDLEEWGRVKEDLSDTILEPCEAPSVACDEKLSQRELLTIIFAAKEALFKALNPRSGKYFGFHSARMKTISLSKRDGIGEFTIELLSDLSEEFSPENRHIFKGKMALDGTVLISVIEVPPISCLD